MGNHRSVAMIYPDSPIKDNGYRIPLTSQLAEGEHIIEIRAVDGNTAHQLAGPERSITVVRDTTAPVLDIIPVIRGDPPVWTMTDQIVIQDAQDAFLDTITAEIGIKLPGNCRCFRLPTRPCPFNIPRDENGRIPSGNRVFDRPRSCRRPVRCKDQSHGQSGP